MPTMPRHLMCRADVLRLTGLSAETIRLNDDVLRPIRLESGHRRYDPALVEKFIADRARRAAG
ncbi:MAG: hypothetical protein WKG01_07670 [Kofleriaceae bacterium]